MNIPESQLEAWSNLGATTTAKSTHESIRSAVESHQFPTGVRFEIFLQGSYRNSTNIRGDSDVDLVVLLVSSWYSDTSRLTPGEKTQYDRDHKTSEYKLHQFKADVLSALRNQFGASTVIEKEKCLHVEATGSRLAADVVVAVQHREFTTYRSHSDQAFVEGIKFQTAVGRRWIINYPKPHYDNGVAKNSDSNTLGRYKPTVRVLKNLRTYLYDHGLIENDLAPSYFVECLLYNVPDELFASTYQETVEGILDWFIQLANAGRLADFTCQNEQMLLFGTTPEQWPLESAHHFLTAVVQLWNNWS